MDEYIFLSKSPAATSALGYRLGESLQARSVLALTGELGCGKTLLTRGICYGLGVPLRQVNSPTFILVNEYSGGRMPVFHMDMYQISAEFDAMELGLIDYLVRAESGIMVIEWAEKILPLLPRDLLKVHFDILSPRKRRLIFSSRGDIFGSLLEGLGKA